MDEFFALLAKRGELEEERRALMEREGLNEFFYVYVLELDNEEYCVGHTDTPLARFTEHAAGTGAVATKGHSFQVKMVQPFGTLEAARYNEGRLQNALALSPANIAAMVGDFERFTRDLRPEKTVGNGGSSFFRFTLKTILGWLMWGLFVCFIWGVSYWGYAIHWTLGLALGLFTIIVTLWWAASLYSIAKEHRFLRKLTKEQRDTYMRISES